MASWSPQWYGYVLALGAEENYEREVCGRGWSAFAAGFGNENESEEVTMLNIAIAVLLGFVAGFAVGRIKNKSKLAVLSTALANAEAKLKAKALEAEAYVKAKL